MNKPKAHVLLIDGNSIAHACNSMTVMRTGDMETQAIYGFLRSIKSLVSSDKNGNAVPYVLWDGRAQFRYDLLPDYKGNRAAKTEEDEKRKERFRAQLPFLYAALSCLGVKQFRCPTLEADDLAGFFTRALNGAGIPVTLVSGDQDWLGLVNNLTDWYDPIRDRRVDCYNFHTFTGCTGGKQYFQEKALRGDTSDNIPPIPRIGKNTMDFIQQWGSVEAFWKAVDAGEYTPKKASKGAKNMHYEDYLASPAGREHFLKNMKLMDLSTPLPEGMVPKMGELKFADNGTGANPENFLKLVERLGFFSILKTADKYLETFGLVNPRNQPAAQAAQPEAIPA